MTEQQKQDALDMIAIRIAKAEHAQLTHTAQSWRELYATVASRPAVEIISVRDFTISLEPTESHHANAAL